jgi:hypothetical protein
MKLKQQRKKVTPIITSHNNMKSEIERILMQTSSTFKIVYIYEKKSKI